MATFTASFQEVHDMKACFMEENNLHAAFGDVVIAHTDDYEKLRNKPKIEGVTLIGDKTFRQLGMDAASVQEVEAILYLG